VLAVFHDLDLAARYADRISVIADGTAYPAAPPAEVIDAKMLRSVFGVRAVVGTDAVTGTVSVTPVLRENAVVSQRRGSVLVVGGSGVAAPLLRRLVLDGWSVRSAAVNVGDTDAQVADALGIAYAPLPPFASMDEAATRTVQAFASDADIIVVCEVPFGHGNVNNLEIAVRSARPLVLVGDIAGRDYTGGQAEALWAEALESGATRVESAADVLNALAEL
jgi:iron complex transport system ATP-binding protein